MTLKIELLASRDRNVMNVFIEFAYDTVIVVHKVYVIRYDYTIYKYDHYIKQYYSMAKTQSTYFDPLTIDNFTSFIKAVKQNNSAKLLISPSIIQDDKPIQLEESLEIKRKNKKYEWIHKYVTHAGIPLCITINMNRSDISKNLNIFKRIDKIFLSLDLYFRSKNDFTSSNQSDFLVRENVGNILEFPYLPLQTSGSKSMYPDSDKSWVDIVKT